MNIETSIIKNEAFSSVDLVHQCLIDTEKEAAFKAAIEQFVTSTSTVLELGTGSGILSLLSARSGAQSVTAIEFDPYIAQVARDNIRRNNAENVIGVIADDARSISFPTGTHFDIVIMEMINTGLVEEMQVQAINNLHAQSLIHHDTVLIPAIQESYITLTYTNFTIHGFYMKMVKQIWTTMDSDTILLSEKKLLNRIAFSVPIPELFSTELAFEIQVSGLLNSVVLSGKTILNTEETIALGSTWSLNPDIIVPMPEKKVMAGESIRVSIEYIFGAGFGHFDVKIIP